MASFDSGDFMGMGLLLKEVGVSKGSGWCEERVGVSDSPIVCSYCSVFIVICLFVSKSGTKI